MAAAAILENGCRLPLLGFLNSACVYQSVYRISSKSDYNCPFYSLNSILKMAAAAILENGRRLPLQVFLNPACFFQPMFWISSKSAYNYPFYSINSIFKMAAAAIFKAISNFRFCFSQLWHDLRNVLVKICQDWTKIGGVITVLVSSIWRLPPSWIWWSVTFDPKFKVSSLVCIYSSNLVLISLHLTEIWVFSFFQVWLENHRPRPLLGGF